MSAGFAGLFVFGAVEDELTKQWARATYFFFRSVFG